MNYKMIFNTLGKVLYLEAAALLLPLITALIYRENSFLALAITIIISLAIGTVFLLIKPKNKVLFAKEGLVISSLTWILMSAVGALPFVISREIPSYVDAFFETVSGFTTTGASILTDVEAMSRGLLMWRSFTHFIGGMGILVLVVALTSKISDRTIHILRAEMPGPTVDKIVPRAKDTAKILYLMYIVMTLVQIVLLLIGGMPLFDSIVHSLGTAGTGGFGIKADGLASYSSYCQWIIAVFMVLFGVNFNIYYLFIAKRAKDAFKSSELRAYFLIIISTTAIISLNIYGMFDNIADTVRHSFFQVATIISTTGYATTDFNLWPSLSKAVLLALMFVGGCAGSTAGGIKVSRVVILLKSVRSELKRVLHPRTWFVVKMDGKKAESGTVDGVCKYLALYVFMLIATVLVISVDGFDFETNFSSAMSCINNVGPGLNLSGPAANYDFYSPFSKVILSITMLLGRLELYPILLTLAPATWLKNK